MRHILYLTFAAAAIFTSGGCGIGVPQISEAWDQAYPGDSTTKPPTPPISANAQIEFEIKKRIFCDLRKAVRASLKYNNDIEKNGRIIKSERIIPLSWGAQIALSLEVEEHSNLSPGIVLINPLPNSQARSIGLGGELSSTATRTDKINAYYSIGYLAQPISEDSVCRKEENDPFVGAGFPNYARSSPFIIESDLGLTEWLVGSMWASNNLPSVETPGKASSDLQNGEAKRPDTISIDIKFEIVTNGNLTPTWKLVRATANTSGSFFDTGRKRTHELIITIGPRNQATDYSHLALQIGQAVNSRANRFPLQ